ncbi:MAG: hypothetical protein QM770_19020 [Tepidisphaeraceae bacterium]
MTRPIATILGRCSALFLVGLTCVLGLSQTARAELGADEQAKADAAIAAAKTLAAEPAIVDAVKAVNAAPSEEAKAMTQEKWKSLPVLDPFVRSFSKNAAAAAIKEKKAANVAEAFVSAANGTKVAFLAKPTNWSHAGKPKHENPMAGKNWTGAIEVDDSTGVKQLQVSVPVLDGDKPIGSLVVGIDISK